MRFSILNETTPATQPSGPAAEVFKDLNLTGLFATFAQQVPVPLGDVFKRPLQTSTGVRYRQAVFTDLVLPAINAAMARFMTDYVPERVFAKNLAQYAVPQVKWYALLSHFNANWQAVTALANALRDAKPQSAALIGLATYLQAYTERPAVIACQQQVDQITAALTRLQYQISVNGLHVTVAESSAPATELSQQLTTVFAPLLQQVQATLVDGAITPVAPERGINSLQAQILQALAQVFPAEFAQLKEFYDRYQEVDDEGLAHLPQEIGFYLAVLRLEHQLSRAYQVSFCLPKFAAPDAAEQVTASFDFALAASREQQVVVNDYRLASAEQFLIISGPNQGGKTTYARMVGVNYYLFALGVPIPGQTARLRLITRVLTHFERQEQATKLTGLLAADVERLAQLVAISDQRSFVILNELFSSTATVDATAMGLRVLALLKKRGTKGIYVTFLAGLNTAPGAVPMMSQVAPDHVTRTFKVVRTAPTGEAYALSLLSHYGLTAAMIAKGGR